MAHGKYILHGGGAGAALPPPQKSWLWCGAAGCPLGVAPHHYQCAACACLAQKRRFWGGRVPFGVSPDPSNEAYLKQGLQVC